MEKKLPLAEKTINKRLIVTVIIITLMILASRFDFGLGVLERFELSSRAETLLVVLGVIMFLAVAFWVSTIRNHRRIGHLYLGSDTIRVEQKGVVEEIPVAEISCPVFKFSRVEGEAKPVGCGLALFSGLLGVLNSSDGSGNYLKFTFNSIPHTFNVVMESSNDVNALHHLFREYAKKHSVVVEWRNDIPRKGSN